MQRRRLLTFCIYLLFILVVFRLIDLMILDHESMARRARIQYTQGEHIPARRGNIYDRNGSELAVSLERKSVYCNPDEVKDPARTVRLLYRITGKKKGELLRKVKAEKKFVWLARKIDPAKAEKIEELRLKGIWMLPDTQRFYPKRRLAAHVIGFVDIDNKGKEGVESRYDRYLRSQARRVALMRDARGNILYTGEFLDTETEDIVLTIDEGLQSITESEILKAVKKWHPRAATAIMMNPYNGEILALANRPTFDPNNPGRYPAYSRRNRAITDLYEPGSTFKIVMAASALEEGVATLYSRVDCSEGYVEVGGRKIRDIHKLGKITLKEVIQKSSNVGAVKMALKLGPQRLYRYMRLLGFGERTGIDLTGESPGIVKPPQRWSGTTIGAVAIGYEVMVTPLQVLRAYATVANGGFLVRPHVVREVISPEGKIISRNDPEARRVISRKTALLLREALKAVVSDDGTAPSASVDGNLVAGKTGTTRLLDKKTGRYSREAFVSSFVGMVPADNPEFVLIVVIWEPKGKYYGGEVAAPVFRAIAEKALAYRFVPRDDMKTKQVLVVDRVRKKEIEGESF
jgi:cell division protein FtsI (penicillin-binding protein 3)